MISEFDFKFIWNFYLKPKFDLKFANLIYILMNW